MSVNRLPVIVSRLRSSLSFGLLPARCLICGARAGSRDLCHACVAALALNEPACPRCALPLEAAAPACGACLADPPAFALAAAAWRYEAAIAQLVPRFKFHRDLACGRVLGELAARRLAQWPGWVGAERVVPVPLHHTRLGQRGYNQALELARCLAAPHALPVDGYSMRRSRATPAQTTLDAAARRRNLRGAFEAVPQAGIVVLVDDVITTGATLDEAARILLRAGAREVRAVAIARVP